MARQFLAPSVVAIALLAAAKLAPASTFPRLAAPPGAPKARTIDPETAHSFELASVQLSASPSVEAVPVSGAAPVLDQPSDMTLRAGRTADQALHATDVDGDPVTFYATTDIRFMTVTTVDPGSGSAVGNIHLAPDGPDIGSITARVSASDGSRIATVLFHIVVTPALVQPSDMAVEESAIADQSLEINDAGSDRYTFGLVDGPAFVTVATTSDSTGNVHLAPGYSDAGSYPVTVSVTNGAFVETKSFQISVANVNRPPVLEQPPDMRAVAYTTTAEPLVASDPDGQELTYFKIAGPSYMSAGPGYPSAGPGSVWLSPSRTDVGSTTATVGVSDGSLTDEKSFGILVESQDADPVFSVLDDMDLAEGEDRVQTAEMSDPDGQRLNLYAWSIPRFMALSGLAQPIGDSTAVATIRLTPTYADSGTYTPMLRISDGWYDVTRSFRITVRNAYPGETSLRLGSKGAEAGSGPDETEYSSVDGTFTPGITAAGDLVTFAFQENAHHPISWALQFRAPAGSVLTEGHYDNVRIGIGGLGASLSASGYDPDLRPYADCLSGTASMTIKRLVRRIDGSVLSFWATFEESCPESLASFRGEVRYQVQGIPITLVAPRWYVTYAGERCWFEISTVDTAGDAVALSATGLPPGATFVDLGGGVGRLGWISSLDQYGDHPIRFTAVSAGGLADTAWTTVRVAVTNHAPEARANGPYAGTVGVPLPFSSVGTSDLDGDSLSYHWIFGDGATSEDPSPTHTYASVGPYPVSLTVTDGILSVGDPTLAVISEPTYGRAFLPEDTGPLRLAAGSGRFCAGVDLGVTLQGAEDVSSVRMHADGLGDAGAIPADSASITVGDSDRNGTSEVTACFSRPDLRRLLANVRGRASVDVVVDVWLRDGRAWSAPLRLDVIGAEAGLSVLVSPNPLNPRGTLTFVTWRAGPARLRLFDIRGRLVRTLLDDSNAMPGYHDVAIDGLGQGGYRLPSGVYLYRLETAEGDRTGRIAIVK